MRFAPHVSINEFVITVLEDLEVAKKHDMLPQYRSLMVNHLNETEQCIYTKEGKMQLNEFRKHPAIENVFNRFYASSTYYAEDI